MDDLAPDRHPRLYQLDALPEGFLDCPVNRLDTLLEGPTLIRLAGERQPPLFVSVLLHGNEVSGFLALQILLKDLYQRSDRLPRELWLFVGNVEAARYGVRRLPGQPDYNRIWAGGDGPEWDMARALLHELDRQPLFAALDVHNNSGRNPIYGCVNRLEPEYLGLARAFSELLVYFTEPHQVLGLALSQRCPAATLECGTSGQPEGVTRVVHLVETLLTRDTVPPLRPEHHPLRVFHTVARVTVSDEDPLGFGYQTQRYPLCFPEQLESLNFRLLEPGTLIAWGREDARGLTVTNNDGVDVTDVFLQYNGERIELRRPCMLSMLTSDITVIYQDCLCYIMEPFPLP
ncbi:MAG: M14 family metallopeptidase [Oleiphilaceae bacterium]|nr:M14 family metallopeptidase [Oleiphilaceae bacterium]